MVVTTALIYANGEIHLGHIVSTYLPADIFTRYCRLKGYQVVHVSATDDYGTPILVKAEQEGKTPEEYVKYWNDRDFKEFSQLGISYDVFYRTSSPENNQLTQHFFRKLYQRGYVFKRKVLQPYCQRDGKYLPDRYVIGTCPYCGALDQYSDGCESCGRTLQPGEIRSPRCAICGGTPTTRESLHYFLRLSSFSKQLEGWLKGNKNLQDEVKNYVLNWIKDGLRDWDITRDISWGVPIPLEEAEGKVLYGWFDNHIGYISTALKHFKDQGKDGKKVWNESMIYHFIGKDIVYHHYLFLPAMRLGVDEYKLPNFMPTRGFLLLQGNKFSKSRGWYVSLKDFLERFPADYLRYYLASITPNKQQDVNFDWDEFTAKINNELVANIGNFIYRALSFTNTQCNGIVPKPRGYSALDRAFRRRSLQIGEKVGAYLEKNENDKALKEVLRFSTLCNQYFQRKKPWSDLEGRGTCVFLAVNAVKSLAILLSPYVPFAGEELWRQLNLQGSASKQNWNEIFRITIKPGHQLSEPKILFRKIEEAEVEAEKKRLAQATQNQ